MQVRCLSLVLRDIDDAFGFLVVLFSMLAFHSLV